MTTKKMINNVGHIIEYEVGIAPVVNPGPNMNVINVPYVMGAKTYIEIDMVIIVYPVRRNTLNSLSSITPLYLYFFQPIKPIPNAIYKTNIEINNGVNHDVGFFVSGATKSE